MFAPPAVKLVMAIGHTVTSGETVIVGVFATNTSTVCVEVHPFRFSPVTVYVVVTDGVETTLEPFAELRLFDGVQV